MVRVTSVLTGRGILSSIFLVMAFGDAFAIAAALLVPKPIVAVMGGDHLNDSEHLIRGSMMALTCISLLLAPFVLLGAAIAFFKTRPTWQLIIVQKKPISRGLRILAAASLLIWVPVLPWTQHEQKMRYRVETDMKAGRIPDAVNAMCSQEKSDFPPLWDPPPQLNFTPVSPSKSFSEMLDVMEQLQDRETPEWVRTVYLHKFGRYISIMLEEWQSFNSRPGDDIARVVKILQRLPERQEIARAVVLDVQHAALRDGSQEERDNFKQLLQLLEKKSP